LEKRKPSGREKDETSVKILGQLREKLHSGNTSVARRAAFTLSWMQEDGLDILREALFGDCPRKAKTAAAYGLRSMRGRMKKMAIEVLQEGSKHSDAETRETSLRSLVLMGLASAQEMPRREPRKPRIEVKEVRNKKPRRQIDHRSPRERR